MVIFGWPVPQYAQPLLIVESDVDFVYVRWCAHNGPVLTYQDQPGENEALPWNGQVIVGGFVERLHARRLADVDFLIAEVVGGAFPQTYRNLPTLDDMKNGLYARPADAEPFEDNRAFPFIIEADSHFAAIAQDALVSGLAVDAVGRLAKQADRWHEICGLPLILESLTLLAAQ